MIDRQELVLAGLLAGERLGDACRRARYSESSWFYLGCLDGFLGIVLPESHCGSGYTAGHRVGEVAKSMKRGGATFFFAVSPL